MISGKQQTIRFERQAALDFDDAVRWYRLRSAVGARRFVESVDRAVSLIERFPKGWPLVGGDQRRILLGRFPYGLLYRVEQDDIVVLAVEDLRRRPPPA